MLPKIQLAIKSNPAGGRDVLFVTDIGLTALILLMLRIPKTMPSICD
jgi:hypothetical protein